MQWTYIQRFGLFFLVYSLAIIAFAGAYHQLTGMEFDEAVLFSIDTIAARGRMDEPAGFCQVARWAAAVETIVGQFAIAMFFAVWLIPVRGKPMTVLPRR